MLANIRRYSADVKQAVSDRVLEKSAHMDDDIFEE